MKRPLIAALRLTTPLIVAFANVSAPAQQFSAWSTPVNMGPSVNTSANEFHVAISADGLTIFFSSDRPGGFGDFDLWVAERPRRDADWGPARNELAGFDYDNPATEPLSGVTLKNTIVVNGVTTRPASESLR